MTTLPRIQIRDPEHIGRTVLRIAFWLAVISLLALLVRSCSDSPRDQTATDTTQPRSAVTEEVGTPSPVATPAANTKAHAPPTRGPQSKPPAPKPPKNAAPSDRAPSRTPTATRPTSRPQPPKPTPPSGAVVPSVPLPPAPPSTQIGAGQGASPTVNTDTPSTSTSAPSPQAPVAPKPPSVHNCDATNETC